MYNNTCFSPKIRAVFLNTKIEGAKQPVRIHGHRDNVSETRRRSRVLDKEASPIQRGRKGCDRRRRREGATSPATPFPPPTPAGRELIPSDGSHANTYLGFSNKNARQYRFQLNNDRRRDNVILIKRDVFRELVDNLHLC